MAGDVAVGVGEREGRRSECGSKSRFGFSDLELLETGLLRGGWRITTDSDTLGATASAEVASGVAVSAEGALGTVEPSSGVRILAAVCKYDRAFGTGVA